jgi:type I restriction enzyme M protein
MSEWGKDSIADDDPRFKYGMAPANNANYAFIQHMISHLGDDGMAATVMANGAMSVQNNSAEIRKGIVKDDLLDAVIALPKALFYTTSIPACILVFSKGKKSDKHRNRKGETLFIDATDRFESVNRTQNRLTKNHIQKISETVRAYRGEEQVGEYEDEKGFCKVADIEDISNNRFIITPGRYVGVKEENEEGELFERKMERLTADLREKFQESAELQQEINKSIEEVGF